jgi:hypothetical protein
MIRGAVGVGAHEGEGSCPMTNLPDCCKKAQSPNHTAEVSMARLCCNLNCSEPGNGGANISASFSAQPGIAPNSAVMSGVTRYNSIVFLSRYANSTFPKDSSRKYIQHLALLI